MKILVTGAAGFIGFSLSKRLLENGHQVVGLDNINDYYSVQLKYERLKELGIEESKAQNYNQIVSSTSNRLFSFVRLDLENREKLPALFRSQEFDVVCNLAAQAGVRYSLENPETYVDSNIVGFLNILENCRYYKIKHLVYASSSSVYGLNEKVPFRTSDTVDHPISIYAASKKSNELMAHTYSHLFRFHTTGLRFFTVYGPWGRPDMALFLFTDAILKGKPIQVFNNGKMERDFTYIDDIVEGIVKILEDPMKNRSKGNDLYKIYNIGNNRSVNLMDFIDAVERNLGKTAIKQMLPMQPGDVRRTWADVEDLIKDYKYSPETPIEYGVQKFITWYKKYYDI